MAYLPKQTSTNFVNRKLLNTDCALNHAIEMLSGRWTTQILFLISFGQNRFGLLKQKLPVISDHILGLRLNHLIKSKLIVKTDDGAEKIYRLTEKGEALLPILYTLMEWQSKR